jgi:hypothetical protein
MVGKPCSALEGVSTKKEGLFADLLLKDNQQTMAENDFM